MKNDCLRKLYHLSPVNHDGETFNPRVPDNIIIGGYGHYEELEEKKTPRVCFSKTISGAFLALNFDGTYEELYVHVPEDIERISRDSVEVPTEDKVWDAEFTREVWVKEPVKMKCIGKVLIGYNLSNTTWKQWRPSVKFRWLERNADR